MTCFQILPNKHRSIRQYLADRRRKLRIFSIGKIIAESIDDCDIRKGFGDYEGAVAVNLDERFAGWKMSIVESMAIKPAEMWKLLDGLIVY